MKKLKYIRNNILFFLTLFLIAFIPLYPKIPLVDIKNTWVYIRFDDVAIVITLIIWLGLIVMRKIRLKTPLTIPIFMFWIIGIASTIHGVLILFPTLSNVFSNVAFLSFIRRVEYMSLFFVGYMAIREKRYVNHVVTVLLITLLAVVFYGFGQKLFGFPAFLTMNEEFAKGIPITLSQLSRIPSTFGGQYDLAAYLVLVVPIIVSMFFGFKNWIVKIVLIAAAVSGFALLFTTVSRISFFAIMVSLALLLIFQKKKWVIAALFVVAIPLLILSPSLLARFGNTVTPVNVLVDTKSGGAIGEVREVDKSYFENKLILVAGSKISASPSATLEYKDMPDKVQVLIKPDAPTGENLPQGTGYINLPLSPILTNAKIYVVENFNVNKSVATASADAYAHEGAYLVKRARAFDLSFTTRFQGEWPNTIVAFKRNIFLGSGYGSVSLAVDNDYLRLLGESGMVGFISFFSIFAAAGIYMKKKLMYVDSAVIRSFVLGFAAGTVGLVVNGALIDVFEASKVAFTFWLLMGVSIGFLHLYGRDDNFNLYKELRRLVISPFAICVYVFIAVSAFLFASYNYYFVGDDFTWLRWVAENSSPRAVFDYFLNANGFFYRPGTMTYFYFMFSAFWLNQTFYHVVSIFLHVVVSVLLFIVLKKVLKDYALAIISTFIFIILSSHHEVVFWISSTGFLFNGMFILSAFLSFIYWMQKEKIRYLIASVVFIFLGLLFHEMGVVAPLILIAYDFISREKWSLKNLFRKTYLILLLPLLPYALLRVSAGSHWFSGDYSYNLLKLPFNAAGNILGYLALDLLGPSSLTFYEVIRNFSRENILIFMPLLIVMPFGVYFLWKLFAKMEKRDQRIIAFGFLFFIICLLPFVGLGNITARYSYLSSAGIAVLLAFFGRKTYFYLVEIADRFIAVLGILIIAMVFMGFQLFQLQKLHADWQGAGNVSKRSIISFQQVYDKRWEGKEMHFYFVGVPIKSGEAWVFPVGFKDALWFALKDKNFTVDMMPDLPSALTAAAGFDNARIFEMDMHGNIVGYIEDVPGYIKDLR